MSPWKLGYCLYNSCRGWEPINKIRLLSITTAEKLQGVKESDIKMKALGGAEDRGDEEERDLGRRGLRWPQKMARRQVSTWTAPAGPRNPSPPRILAKGDGGLISPTLFFVPY